MIFTWSLVYNHIWLNLPRDDHHFGYKHHWGREHVKTWPIFVVYLKILLQSVLWPLGLKMEVGILYFITHTHTHTLLECLENLCIRCNLTQGCCRIFVVDVGLVLHHIVGHVVPHLVWLQGGLFCVLCVYICLICLSCFVPLWWKFSHQVHLWTSFIIHVLPYWKLEPKNPLQGGDDSCQVAIAIWLDVLNLFNLC